MCKDRRTASVAIACSWLGRRPWSHASLRGNRQVTCRWLNRFPIGNCRVRLLLPKFRDGEIRRRYASPETIMSVTFFSADDGRSNYVLDIPALVDPKRPPACHPRNCGRSLPVGRLTLAQKQA